MAQRYGRRRKRAHLARIAELTEAHQRETSLCRHLGSEVRRLNSRMEEWDDEITRLLGEYSAFRRETPVVETSHPLRELPIRPRIADAYRSLAMAGGFPEMETMVRERMYRFFVFCDQDDMRMRQIIRLIEHDRRTGEFAYSISEAVLRTGFGQREIEYLAMKIAREMSDAFNRRRDERKTDRAQM